jgi:hypothetical protein
MAGTGTPA